jgi:hypothetical protein
MSRVVVTWWAMFVVELRFMGWPIIVGVRINIRWSVAYLRFETRYEV